MYTGSSAAEDPSEGPSAGAQAVATLTDLVTELGCIHKTAQHLTGSHETGVFINPENPNEFFHMTPKRIALWAKAIRNNPGEVTLRVPPKLDSFQFKTKDNMLPPPPPVLAQPPTPVLEAALQFPNSFGVAMPHEMIFNPMHMAPASSMAIPPLMHAGTSQKIPGTPEHPKQALSPSTPTHDDSSIEEFLQFAYVNLESPKVCNRMSALGITHWTMFKWFKADKLASKGIPKGPA
ncbi:hypothetical protein PTTG_00076 [Puccinia triticina 1-1 BBBD Race 1]|uniref:Uncharacterized protein n=1 Tax=Puccinia triticina (isolate 1-1 / race 1 (BBBD)) TaxID=630390 RepID=A0A0C4EH60_PUCT1|nr:hypothetical protein PTTG_00076 [Puccinia triticina 1-1 BBBD Race 1]